MMVEHSKTPSESDFSSRELAAELATTASAEPREAPIRPLEIIHHPHVDVLINHTARLATYGPAIAEACRDGIPGTWQAPSLQYAHVRVGEIAGQTFMAKTRRYRLESDDLEKLKALPPEQQDKPVLGSNFTKRERYGFESITSELRLAPMILAAIDNNPTLQEEIKALGFNGLRYTEPLVGIIDNNPDHPGNRKSIVYEYVADGAAMDKPAIWKRLGQPYSACYQLVRTVRKHLQAGGINPADLEAKQILMTPDQWLHLLDTEAYTKLPVPAQQAREAAA